MKKKCFSQKYRYRTSLDDLKDKISYVCEKYHDRYPKRDCEQNHNTCSSKYCDLFHNPVAIEATEIDRSTSLSAQSASLPQASSGNMRLNRFLANCGICSRRKAEDLIRQRRVTLNGDIVTDLATQVNPADRVELDGKEVCVPTSYDYYILYKPIQVVSTAHDPQGRKTVVDLLPDSLKNKRVFPVGRLDYFSEGLLLMTNDGELANRLMHPRFHLGKIYEVIVRGSVPEKVLQAMRGGMTLIGREYVKLQPVGIEAKVLPTGNTLLVMTLRQGLNRQIRRMAQQFNLTILKLKRVGEGPIRIGNMKAGEIRALSESELKELKAVIGYKNPC